MVYVPGCTAAVMLIAPVVVFSVNPVGHVPLSATVALPHAPSVAATPFTVSLLATFAIGVDAVPDTPVPLSATGVMFALTVTVSVTVLQFAGVFLSHNV